MTVTAATPRARTRTEPRWLLLHILFASVLCVPLLILFARTNSYISERANVTSQERLGVEYLRALQPVSDALAAAQSAAVAGRPPAAGSLNPALDAMSAVDERLGGPLGAHERWTGLRAKIATLPAQGTPRALLDAYGETADLLLALYDVVRQNALLAVDPAPDTYNLQSGVATHLPELTVAIGRYADLALLARGHDEDISAQADLLAQRRAALDAGERVVDTVQSALAGTTSTTLSEALFNELDAVRFAMEAVTLARGAIDGQVTDADLRAVDAQRVNVNRAAAALDAKVLDQLDQLLADRLDQVGGDRTLAVAAIAGGGLLVAIVLVIGLTGFARTVRAARAAREQREQLPEPPHDPDVPRFPVWSSAAPALPAGEPGQTGGRERTLAR